MTDRVDAMSDWLGDVLLRFMRARVLGVQVALVAIALLLLFDFVAIIWYIFFSQPLCDGGGLCDRARKLPWE